MRKKKNKKTAAAGKTFSKKSKKGVVPLWPDNLPLEEKWYTLADLMALFQVGRSNIDRYRGKGLLREHNLGGTLRFNKAYVDWMIQNGNKKLSWISAFLAITNSFDWVV